VLPCSFDSPNECDTALAFSKLHTPGNIPEAAITLILDGVIVELMYRQGITGETLSANHANLE
jgi:ketol-acid reductoisomerase